MDTYEATRSAIEKTSGRYVSGCLSEWVFQQLVPELESHGLSIQEIDAASVGEERLRPCPFCGSNHLRGAIEKGTMIARVLCVACGSTGPGTDVSEVVTNACAHGWQKRDGY